MARNMIQRAVAEFRQRYPLTRELQVLRDAVGTYAVRVECGRKKYFISAKSSQDGDKLSIHKQLLADALNENAAIIIWLNEKYFYRFLPQDISRASTNVNVSPSGAEMVNFPLRIGINIDHFGGGRGVEIPKELLEHPMMKKLIEDFGLEVASR